MSHASPTTMRANSYVGIQHKTKKAPKITSTTNSALGGWHVGVGEGGGASDDILQPLRREDELLREDRPLTRALMLRPCSKSAIPVYTRSSSSSSSFQRQRSTSTGHLLEHIFIVLRSAQVLHLRGHLLFFVFLSNFCLFLPLTVPQKTTKATIDRMRRRSTVRCATMMKPSQLGAKSNLGKI